MAEVTEIPQMQKAAMRVGRGESATTSMTQIPVDGPGPGQILVKIEWTRLCGSDKSLVLDEWADRGASMRPAAKGIARHKTAGVVVKVGAGIEKRSGVRRGQWIVTLGTGGGLGHFAVQIVTLGAGGGLGHFAVQFAQAMMRYF